VFSRSDQEQHAVVFLRFAELPEAEQLIGIGLDIAACSDFTVATTSWMPDLSSRSRLRLDLVLARWGHDSRLVDHAAAQRRKIEGKGNSRRQTKDEARKQPSL
jgi:hypothetical protein